MINVSRGGKLPHRTTNIFCEGHRFLKLYIIPSIIGRHSSSMAEEDNNVLINDDPKNNVTEAIRSKVRCIIFEVI